MRSPRRRRAEPVGCLDTACNGGGMTGRAATASPSATGMTRTCGLPFQGVQVVAAALTCAIARTQGVTVIMTMKN